MIISIILMYLIINSFYIYSLTRSIIDFTIINDYKFRKNILILLLYLVFFIGILRLLSLLREHKLIDLKLIFNSNDIIIIFLVLILVWAVRRFVTLYIKIVFFKLHYFLLSPYTIGYNKIYARFYINCIYTPVKKYFSVIQIINLVLTIILVILLIRDLVFNNLILDLSLGYLKYFGLFKFCYICLRFIAKKQDLISDYYAYNLTYPGDIRGEFWQNFDDDLADKENHYRFEVIGR